MKRNAFVREVKKWFTFLEVEKNVSQHTLRAYKSDIRQFEQFWQRIEQEEKKVEHDARSIMHRYGVMLYYKKIGKKSLARKISCLRSFAHFMRSQGQSFSIETKLPRLDKTLPPILSVDEIFYLLDQVKIEDLPSGFPYRDKALFETIYATGARCSEAINMSVNDLNFKDKTIKVFGKGRVERLTLFGEKAKKALQLYLEHEWEDLSQKKGSSYLFLNKDGSKLTPRSVQRIFEMFRSFLKVDRKLTPHTLRHSFATHMLNQGADIRIVQELLGHRTLMTTEIYTQVSSKELATMCDSKHPLKSMDDLIVD